MASSQHPQDGRRRTRAVRWFRTRGRAGQYALGALGLVLVLGLGVLGYYYVTFAAIIDTRLHGEREQIGRAHV